jgi:hypothetical protein
MHNIFKFEGRIERIETHDSVFNAFGGSDSLVTSSAILSAVSGSVSLGAQTVFLASSSKLRTDTVVMEIDGKICSRSISSQYVSRKRICNLCCSACRKKYI